MEFKTEIIVLKFNRWEMIDEKTKERKKGVTLVYLGENKSSPILGMNGKQTGEGMQPFEVSIADDGLELVAPACYEAVFGFGQVKVGDTRKVTQKIVIERLNRLIYPVVIQQAPEKPKK